MTDLHGAGLALAFEEVWRVSDSLWLSPPVRPCGQPGSTAKLSCQTVTRSQCMFP